MTAHAITVLPSSRTLRRRVGPLAWVLLEELAFRADSRSDGLSVQTNVRELGATLDIGKDTVAKALGRLVDLGLIRSENRRIAGRYAGCAYVVDSEACRRAGILITRFGGDSSPHPGAPCPIEPDAAAGDAASPLFNSAAGTSRNAAPPDDQNSISPSLFDLPDQPPTPTTQLRTPSHDPSITSSLLPLQPALSTTPPSLLPRSDQPDALAPGVRRGRVNVPGKGAGGRSALTGNLNGKPGSGC